MSEGDLRNCDIVMQGGITSGVVYPGLVCRLAKQYQFKSIGGTSAGAIAAALTAAAEYARRKGNASAFDEIAKVPAELGETTPGGISKLFALFQPQEATEELFRIATACLLKSWGDRLRAWVDVLSVEVLLGALPSIALCFLACGLPLWRHLLIIALSIPVLAAGWAVSLSIGLLLRIARLPSQHFGLCAGFASPTPGEPPSLVSWLNDKINTIAGTPPSHPLTFGDLETEGITLRMMTTCLTWSRPFTLPFQQKIFYYDPNELSRFFPPEVMDWMKQHPAQTDRPNDPHDPVDPGSLLRLPEAKDLPIIVAARLSLSFPFLFCAVPLYAVDFTLKRQSATDPAPTPCPGAAIPYGKPRTPECVWFTDGGICNNFPLHLFDSPIPSWPTFAIDLTRVRPDRPDEPDRAHMPRSNRAGIQPSWIRLNPTTGIKTGLSSTLALIFSIIDAARNWVNQLQAVVPGYRDRIVHVALTEQEGGLNLSMTKKDIDNLSGYGTQAGDLLVEHFLDGKDHGQPTPMTWNNHRWIRLRSTMSLLEKFLSSFAEAFDRPEPHDISYTDLIDRAVAGDAPSYPLIPDQPAHIKDEALRLVELGRDLNKKLMEPKAPNPEPDLLIRPSF